MTTIGVHLAGVERAAVGRRQRPDDERAGRGVGLQVLADRTGRRRIAAGRPTGARPRRPGPPPARRASGWALGGRQVFHPDHADDRLLVHQADGERQPDDDERRVQQGRQAEDDEQRPPVAEQVADLAPGDQSDDGAAHGDTLAARVKAVWGCATSSPAPLFRPRRQTPLSGSVKLAHFGSPGPPRVIRGRYIFSDATFCDKLRHRSSTRGYQYQVSGKVMVKEMSVVVAPRRYGPVAPRPDLLDTG